MDNKTVQEARASDQETATPATNPTDLERAHQLALEAKEEQAKKEQAKRQADIERQLEAEAYRL